MTDNQQRAAAVASASAHRSGKTLENNIAAALDAAEQRGRAEVAARVQAALNGALMVPQAEIRRALEGDPMTTPDPVTDVWELLWTAACDYRDRNPKHPSVSRLVDALMPIVRAYGDARAAEALEQAADTAHGHEWWEASGDLYARAVALRSEESA